MRGTCVERSVIGQYPLFRIRLMLHDIYLSPFFLTILGIQFAVWAVRFAVPRHFSRPLRDVVLFRSTYM